MEDAGKESLEDPLAPSKEQQPTLEAPSMSRDQAESHVSLPAEPLCTSWWVPPGGNGSPSLSYFGNGKRLDAYAVDALHI